MAQEILIPVSFQFRTAKVQWREACAGITGWRREQGATKKSAQLIAEIMEAGKKRAIAVPPSSLPTEYRQQCFETLGTRHCDAKVREICAGLELRCFIHDSKTYIADSDLRRHSNPADAWQLREDLFDIKDDEAALAFLNKWGRWIPFRNYVDLPEILALQQSVRHALTSSANDWFQSLYASPPMFNSRSQKFPFFVILTDSCQTAIRTTTTVDLLRKMRFKNCARPDCPKPFVITSKHERSYCGQYCAHLESVRRSRKSTTQRSG